MQMFLIEYLKMSLIVIKDEMVDSTMLQINNKTRRTSESSFFIAYFSSTIKFN